MDFIHKKTTELSDKETEQFCSLFSNVFIKSDKHMELFKGQFLNSALGYSYHALMFSNGILVGAHNEIPVNYKINGENRLLCVGADTMIKEGFRSLPNLVKLVKLCEKAIKEDGINFIFGFPNINSHSIMNKVFKFRDIGCLKTYILPYRIGGIKSIFKFLNPLSIAGAYLISTLSHLRKNNKLTTYMIDKDREIQAKYRFKWFSGNYKICQIKDFTFIYRILTKDGVKTAFLIDIDRVCPINLAAAVRHIIKMDSKNFDLIIYVGDLPFNAFPLIKVPKIFEPKKFYFHGKFLDITDSDESFFEIKNWNVNLLCYDLV